MRETRGEIKNKKIEKLTQSAESEKGESESSPIFVNVYSLIWQVIKITYNDNFLLVRHLQKSIQDIYRNLIKTSTEV